VTRMSRRELAPLRTSRGVGCHGWYATTQRWSLVAHLRGALRPDEIGNFQPVALGLAAFHRQSGSCRRAVRKQPWPMTVTYRTQPTAPNHSPLNDCPETLALFGRPPPAGRGAKIVLSRRPSSAWCTPFCHGQDRPTVARRSCRAAARVPLPACRCPRAAARVPLPAALSPLPGSGRHRPAVTDGYVARHAHLMTADSVSITCESSCSRPFLRVYGQETPGHRSQWGCLRPGAAVCLYRQWAGAALGTTALVHCRSATLLH
jgi:hypothetical protein